MTCCVVLKNNNYFLPNKNFRINDPNFLSIPPLVVGTPVLLAKEFFILEIPVALFQENDNPNFFPILLFFVFHIIL